jgi:hypothetical protein
LSILTKICVVILVVINLVAAGFFINMATTPRNYRVRAEQAQLQSERYAQAAAHARLVNKVLIDQRDEYRQELASARNEMLRTSGQLRGRIASLETEIGKIRKEKAALEAIAQGAQNSLQAEQERSIALRDELQDQQKATNEAREQNRRLADLLSEREVQLSRMRQMLEKTRVDLADREERIKELSDRIDAMAAGGGDGGARPAAMDVPGDAGVDGGGVPVYGTVTAYNAEDNIVSINIGTAKGIRKDMKLTVYRGDEFVAYVRIEYVDVTNAMGIVTTQRLTPRQGDKVMAMTE